MMSVTILKQHYQYEMVTSQIYRTIIISTIKYDNTKMGLFFMPVHDILEDLEIKDSQGRHMAVLSDKELLEQFGIDKSKNLPNPEGNSARTLDVIPILLTPSNSPYEKIFFTYTAPIKLDRYEKTKFSPEINIDFRFKVIPHEFMLFTDKYDIKRQPFDIHILFKAEDNYTIRGLSKINIYPQKDDHVIQAKQNTSGSIGYFIPAVEFDDVIIGNVNVGLADSLLNTATIVSIITLLVPSILLAIPFVFGKFFTPTLEIIGGSIALLIGERLWIFKDKFIMRRWLGIQKSLLIFNGFAFFIWLVLWSLES